MREGDWIGRMWATLEAARERPAVYGNCVLLAAEVIEAIAGVDYVNEAGTLIAQHQAEPVTLEALEDFVTARLGAPLPTIRQACQGDVVLLNPPEGPALGICVGHQVAVSRQPKGVAYLRLERALKAWRVP